MALPNLSALSLGPSSRRRSLLGLAKDAEDTEGKRSSPGDDVEADVMDVSDAGTEATDKARETPPAKAARIPGMQFCMLLHGQERATDEAGVFVESLPTRSQLAANLPDFQAACSNMQAGQETVAVVRGDGGTAGVVYDPLTLAVLAVATLQNDYLNSPDNWKAKMAQTYHLIHGPSPPTEMQEFAKFAKSGDVSQWVLLFNNLSVVQGLAFYVDFVCSAASTARLLARRGAGTLVMQGVADWISNQFIRPTAKMVSLDHQQADLADGAGVVDAAGSDVLALGRIRALTWFHLQSLPTAEGFWGGRMHFVKYFSKPPLYFRWVEAFVQEPDGPRRLMPLPEEFVPGVSRPFDNGVDMMDEKLALLIRALHAVLLLWYPFLRPTMPSTPTKVTTVRQFLEWYDKYTHLGREFGPGVDGELNVSYVARKGGEELTDLQRDFVKLLTMTLVDVVRPTGRNANLFFGERGSLASNNFHHFKYHLLTQAGKEGLASNSVLNKVPAREWETLRTNPPSTYVGDFVRSVAELVDAAPDSMKVNVVPQAATSYGDVDVQLVEHVKALYAVFFLWYPQVRPGKKARYKHERIKTLKEFVELYNRYMHTMPRSNSLVKFKPMERAGHGSGAIGKMHEDLLTLAYSSLRNVRRLGASADALGPTGTLDEAFLAYAKEKMREATLVNQAAAPKALDRVAESYWKELREAGLLQEAAQPAGPPSGSNEHFVRTALERITNPWDISDGSLDLVLAEVHKVAQALHGLCYKLRPTSPFLIAMFNLWNTTSLLDVPHSEFQLRIHRFWHPFTSYVSNSSGTGTNYCANHVRNAVISALMYIGMSGEALEKLADDKVRPGERKRASREAVRFMLDHIAKVEMPDKALSDSQLVYGNEQHWAQLYASPPYGRIGAIFTAFRQAEHLEAYHKISVAKGSLERSRKALEHKKRDLKSYTERGGAEALLARIRGEIAAYERAIVVEATTLEELQTKRAALPAEPIGQLPFQRLSNMPDE